MIFATSPLSVVPVRNSSNHRSEMLSQVLFGELVEIIESKGNQWVKIRCDWDDTVGWVAKNQLLSVSQEDFYRFRSSFAYNLDLLQPAMSDEYVLPLTLGAQLPAFDGLRFSMSGKFYSFPGQAVFPEDITPSEDFIQKIAKRYLHAPYLLGGRSPLGIDGPGLVQMVFKMAGFKLGRTADEQVESGIPVHFAEQSMVGDIAILENSRRRIVHSGIILPENNIIHAFGKVRIDKLDHFGIFDPGTGKYSHKLRLIKRLPLEQASAKKNAAGKASTSQFELF